jgi:hypothetical protein
MKGYRAGRAHAAKHARWLAQHLEDEVAIVDEAEPVESEELTELALTLNERV